MSVYRPGTNKSSTLNYPTIRPSLNLDFANTKTLDPRITFTRSSAGSYVGADGLIKYAGVNEARFDHDPITGESLGLLIEESRANLLTGSQEFTISRGWTPINVNVIPNTDIAPDGTLTAYRVSNTPNINSFLAQVKSLSLNTTYTVSVYAKFISGNGIIVFEMSGFGSASFNLLTLSAPSGGTITSLSNSWYRIQYTFTTGATGTPSFSTIYFGAYGTSAKVNTVAIWGAQVEQGSFASSYIPTLASTRTRAADDGSILGTNFTSWYNQDESSFIVTFKSLFPNTFNDVIGLSPSPSALMSYYTLNSGVTDMWGASTFAVGAINSTNGLVKFARVIKFADNRSLIISNPYKTTQSPPLTKFTANGIRFGTRGSGGVYENRGFQIKQVTYYPKALTDAQLLTLTTI